MRLRSNLSADAALLMTTLIWGTTFVLAKDVLAEWTTLAYITSRFALAALAFVVLFPKQIVRANRAEWRMGATLGFFVGAGFLLQAAGQNYTTPSKSAFITGLTTPLVPFIAFAVLRARPGVENLIGVLLASIGGALILAPHGEMAGAAGSATRSYLFGVNAGDALTLASDVLFALHITLMSVYTRRAGAARLSVLQIAVAALLFIAAWLAFGNGLTPLVNFSALRASASTLRAAHLLEVVYLALFGTVLTFLLWTWGQARMSATHAAIIFSLEPVFATAFAVALRGKGEWLGARGGLGAGLVLAGVLVSEIKWGKPERGAREGEREEGVDNRAAERIETLSDERSGGAATSAERSA